MVVNPHFIAGTQSNLVQVSMLLRETWEQKFCDDLYVDANTTAEPPIEHSRAFAPTVKRESS